MGVSRGETPDSVAGVDTDFPSLRTVPRETTANTDPAYWARVEAEIKAAAQAALSHPRAQDTPSEDAAAFIEQARRDLEAARAAHQPE